MRRSLLTLALAVAGTLAGALSACRSRMDVTAGAGPISGPDGSVHDGADASLHDDLDAGASAAIGHEDAGDAAGACKRVMPQTEAGTCPVMPPGGVLCDRSEVASGYCGAPECPPSAGCCSYGTAGGDACFPVCGGCGTGVPRQVACVPEGSCTTDADCQGALPRICQSCPLTPDGQAAQGCAHWLCKAGQCQVGYCAPGLVCQGGEGCPSYYLPPVDRSCTTDADCVLVEHQQSCCTTLETAVRASDEQRFADEEKQCASIHSPDWFACQCAGWTQTEDGPSPGPGQSIAAACVAGTCKAVIAGRLKCGTTACDPGQSCCTSPDDAGACVYSCAASCPIVKNDAGAVVACRAE